MKRNASIDFLRALMMLGIVLLHMVASPERWDTWRPVACMLLPCVVGFVFISGYFSVKFSWRKLVALYGTAFWCLGVIWVISGASFGEMVEMFKGKWFLHAYAILMCGAPIVALALEKSQKSVLPFLCVVFGWGFLSHMAFVHHYIPQMPEFDAKSGVTLIGIYCAARLYRLNEGRFDSVRSCWYGLALLPLLALCAFGQGWFGNYNSPVALLLALCVFHLVKQIRLPNVVRGTTDGLFGPIHLQCLYSSCKSKGIWLDEWPRPASSLAAITFFCPSCFACVHPLLSCRFAAAGVGRIH